MKKYINKLITLAFSDMENISGIVVDYNENWTLMKHNPVDYVIDGYILIRHKNIDGFVRGKEEKFTEKVIKLKEPQILTEEKIQMDDLATILSFLSELYGVVQLNTKSARTCYLGSFVSANNKQLVIKNFSPEGKWVGTLKFNPNKIRTVQFDNDYINSLKLVSTTRRPKM